jgi:hypothetical protein
VLSASNQVFTGGHARMNDLPNLSKMELQDVVDLGLSYFDWDGL